MAASRTAALPMLSTAEAARRIGIHPNTLRSYADQDLIAHVRLPGGHRRFPADAVEAFIARLHDRSIPEPTQEQMDAILRAYGEA